VSFLFSLQITESFYLMKLRPFFFIVLVTTINLTSCRQKENPSDMNIIFLHHSTGEVIWNGTPPSIIKRVASKFSDRLATFISRKAQLQLFMEKYNKEHNKNYSIREMAFPKASPYGWNNNPFDYYNIWVKHAGEEPFMQEPTLEMLTQDYQVIIFKHCFPVSNIQPDLDTADINSYYRSIANYKLQYSALKEKMQAFPNTIFIVFTGAAQVQGNVKESEALRAREFFTWVNEEWDLPGDNIFVWDLYSLETEGGLYFKDESAVSPNDSHPNKVFAKRAGTLLFNRIIDIIENKGENTTLTGEMKQL